MIVYLDTRLIIKNYINSSIFPKKLYGKRWADTYLVEIIIAFLFLLIVVGNIVRSEAIAQDPQMKSYSNFYPT